AQWLGTSLETQTGRDFTARFSRSSPAEKVELLRAESARLGLDRCPIIYTWARAASLSRAAQGRGAPSSLATCSVTALNCPSRPSG
ncbi:MAG: hypothetical protein AAGC55_22885, partial [Myxococcota bacterium]